MAAAYKAIVADRKDLERVIVHCSGCWTGVSVVLSGAKGITYCPSCERPFPDDARSAVQALARFVEHARRCERANDEKPVFQFEIKIDGKLPALE